MTIKLPASSADNLVKHSIINRLLAVDDVFNFVYCIPSLVGYCADSAKFMFNAGVDGIDLGTYYKNDDDESDHQNQYQAHYNDTYDIKSCL
jgi:hypothetical protein